MNPYTTGQAYSGPIKAVILDWAGTAVDYGCFGPVAAFQRAFQHFGINPSVEETRRPMGMEKKAHIKTMLADPELKAQWQEKYGREASAEDIDAIFLKTLEIMPEILAQYSDPVPGCEQTMAELRSRNIAIGSCTGYSRSMMKELVPLAAAKGFKPDFIAASDEVPQGRPHPWMCWLNCVKLGVFPPEAVVKAGDTVIDIQEGRNAGHWTVAVVHSSNGLGATPDQIASLTPEELYKLEAPLAKAFSDAGAHYVISSLSELPKICDDINRLLQMGVKP